MQKQRTISYILQVVWDVISCFAISASFLFIFSHIYPQCMNGLTSHLEQEDKNDKNVDKKNTI